MLKIYFRIHFLSGFFPRMNCLNKLLRNEKNHSLKFHKPIPILDQFFQRPRMIKKLYRGVDFYSRWHSHCFKCWIRHEMFESFTRENYVEFAPQTDFNRNYFAFTPPESITNHHIRRIQFDVYKVFVEFLICDEITVSFFSLSCH